MRLALWHRELELKGSHLDPMAELPGQSGQVSQKPPHAACVCQRHRGSLAGKRMNNGSHSRTWASCGSAQAQEGEQRAVVSQESGRLLSGSSRGLFQELSVGAAGPEHTQPQVRRQR